MDNISKIKLFVITLLLDLYLIYISVFYQLDYIDIFWILSVFFCHISFYIALYNENRQLLDILHYFVGILPLLSLFISNIFLKILSLFLLLLIQILWIIEKRCILNEGMEHFGYGDLTNYYIIILTPILAFNIGYLYNN